MTSSTDSDLMSSMDQTWLMKRSLRGIAVQIAASLFAALLVVLAWILIGDPPPWLSGLLATLLLVDFVVTFSCVHFWWGTYKAARQRRDYYDARDEITRAVPSPGEDARHG